MLRVHNFCISVDGYGAGPDQRPEDPIGTGGERLHDWMFQTRTGRRMSGPERSAGAANQGRSVGLGPTPERSGGGGPSGQEGGSEGVDDEMIAAGDTGIGATIMGRNMFGPVRGPWAADETWAGWWGADPPFHHPVFVLTNHARPSVTMQGGTVFHFVTDGIEAALARAVEAAGGLDVRLGGGVSTIQQYLRAGLVDQLHVAIIPIVLHRGERLFADGLTDGLTCTKMVATDAATHVILNRA